MKPSKKDISNPLISKGKPKLGIFFSPFSIINPEEEGSKFTRFLSIGHHFKSESVVLIDEEYVLFMMLIDAPLWNGTLFALLDKGTRRTFSSTIKAGLKEVKFSPNVKTDAESYQKSKKFLSSFKTAFEKSEAIIEGYSENGLPYDFHFDLFGKKAFSAVSSKLDGSSLVLCQSDYFRSQGFLNLSSHEFRVSENSLAFVSRVDGSLPKGKKIESLILSFFDKDNKPLTLVLSSLPNDGFNFLKSEGKTFFIIEPASFSLLKGYTQKDGTIIPTKIKVESSKMGLLFVEDDEKKLEAKRLGVFDFATLIRFGTVSGNLTLVDGRTFEFNGSSAIIQENVDSK